MKYSLILLLLLSGCSLLQVKSEPIERVKLNIQEQSALNLKPINVVLKDEFICVSENDYKTMLYDLSLIQNWITIERQTLDSYRQYYEPIK